MTRFYETKLSAVGVSKSFCSFNGGQARVNASGDEFQTEIFKLLNSISTANESLCRPAQLRLG